MPYIQNMLNVLLLLIITVILLKNININISEDISVHCWRRVESKFFNLYHSIKKKCHKIIRITDILMFLIYKKLFLKMEL